MSAVFQLDFTGPQVSCDYPGCIAGSFHEGDHQFAAVKTQFPLPSQYNRTCCICGIRFAVLIDGHSLLYRTCGQEECVLDLARRELSVQPVTCTCLQRPYPHDLCIHKAIKFESREWRWPWSLRFAPEMEA